MMGEGALKGKKEKQRSGQLSQSKQDLLEIALSTHELLPSWALCEMVISGCSSIVPGRFAQARVGALGNIHLSTHV